MSVLPPPSRPSGRPFRIAAITTVYRPLSHADVLISRWLTPRETDPQWGWHGPKSEIASIYVEQFPDNDMARGICQEHAVPLCPSIREALTLGQNKLAVDAVLLIGEHGDYPLNDLGQKLYPRKELFDAIVEVFQACGQAVPVFCDKHYSWDFEAARAMVATADRLGFQFFGGSSVPLCERRPGTPALSETGLEEVVAVFTGGDESYGFHSIEFAQSVIEERPGGERGIAAITAYRGEQVWEAQKAGAWSAELMVAAAAVLEPNPEAPHGDEGLPDPTAWVIEHVDGLRVTHINLNRQVRGWSVAGRLPGRHHLFATTTIMGGAPEYYPNFAALARVVEGAFLSGQYPFPPERTLLATGAVAAVMHALAKPGERRLTPELNVTYAPAAPVAAAQR